MIDPDIKKSGIGSHTVAQWVRPQPVTMATHMDVSSILPSLFSIQFPYNGLGKGIEDDISVWPHYLCGKCG